MLKRPIIILATLSYFGTFILITLALGYSWSSTRRAPEQPIAFPHTIHVSRLGMACNYCHVYVDKSRHAGVPPVEKCMACHGAIATDKPEIKKLTWYFEEKKPIEWNRVYSLPDHVYFTHKRHVLAKIACSECHGNVGAMKKIRKVSSLKMGWCVFCHRERGAPLDCATCHK